VRGFGWWKEIDAFADRGEPLTSLSSIIFWANTKELARKQWKLLIARQEANDPESVAVLGAIVGRTYLFAMHDMLCRCLIPTLPACVQVRENQDRLLELLQRLP
jgi:hypothetical protein